MTDNSTGELTAQGLIADAVEQTGLDDFSLPSSDAAGEDWREGLEVLVSSATSEAQMNPVGVATLQIQLSTYLRNRLQVLDWARRHIALLQTPVKAPVIITGHGRTGTTLLSYLLDQDHNNRSLMGWEAASPIPPPRAETFATDLRIQAATQSLQMMDELRPAMKTIHREAPDGPTECVTLLAQACCSLLYETLWNLPSYGEWLTSRPHTDAYLYHRVALQVLQSEAPGRWVLKSPHHALALPEILSIYPDARIILLHRDPAVSFASVLNLITTFTSYNSDHSWADYIRTRWLHVWQETIKRMTQAQQRWPDRFINVQYSDLMANPLGAVGEIYTWLGWDFPADTNQAIKSWLADNPQGKHGRHSYSLEDFGYTEADARKFFGEYVEAYSIDS